MPSAHTKTPRGERKAEGSEVSKAVPNGIDTSTFFSPTIPSEVRVAVPLIHGLEETAFHQILELSASCVKGNGLSESDFIDLQTSLHLESSTIGAVFTGVYTIIRMAVRNLTKANIISRDLLAMKLPVYAAEAITSTVKSNRVAMEQAVIANRVRFPTLEALQWRVDIGISSSSLSRVMRPSILMQMTLSDGRMRTMEVPLEQFNQLRYNTAKVLRDMRNLEGHPIMRLAISLDNKDKKADRFENR